MSNALPGVEVPGRPPDCTLVIFGASGDLTRRKLLPALYNLGKESLLPEHFAIVGVAIDPLDTEQFRRRIAESVLEFGPPNPSESIIEHLQRNTEYISGSFDNPATYERVKAYGGNIVFYLAVPPTMFCPIVEQLGRAGLAKEQDGAWRRVVIEKPFGQDYQSANALNAMLGRVLAEHQIYRIDHYLGKETVQNIIVFRFSNGIFEPIWNRRFVEYLQITAAETVGVEQRGAYYENAGALRDMVPNHLFQLLSLVAMEPPVSFHPNAVRDEQEKIIQAMPPMAPEEVLTRTVRGQYRAGEIDGQRVAGYREEPNVSPTSNTETFVALKLLIENWRWAGIPFYIRTGKRMTKRLTEISIQFRRAPHMLFRNTHVDALAPNRLILHLQPEEGISLSFGAKVPGATVSVGTVNMDFRYEDYFGRTPSTGYERLLYDCMIGDATLFRRADMVEDAWKVLTPVIDVWSALPPRNFPNYAAGTWGPKEADELLLRDGHHWRNP